MIAIQRLMTVGFTILGLTLVATTTEAAPPVTYPQLLQMLHQDSSDLQSEVNIHFGRFPGARNLVADTARLHQMAERIEQAGVQGNRGMALEGLQKFDRQLALVRTDLDVVTRGGHVGHEPHVAGLLRQLGATSARLQGHSHLRPVPVVAVPPVVVHPAQPYYTQQHPARSPRYGRGPNRSRVYIQTPNFNIGVVR